DTEPVELKPWVAAAPAATAPLPSATHTARPQAANPMAHPRLAAGSRPPSSLRVERGRTGSMPLLHPWGRGGARGTHRLRWSSVAERMAPMQVLPGSGRAAERLDSELIGWISTVTRNGRPQSSPVWCVVHDGSSYLQSQP